LRTSALRTLVLSALFLTCFSIPNTNGQVAVPATTGEASSQEASGDLIAPAGSPSPTLQATETPNGSSVVELNGHAVAETPRRFHYTFGLVVRGVYDDNINLNQTTKTSDFYASIEPTISLGLGGTGEDQKNFLNFVYAPNAFIFAKTSSADAIQHIIHLAGQRQFGKVTLSLGEDIQILDSNNLTSLNDTTGQQANIDVRQRTRENIFDTKLGASYDLSSKTFLTGSAEYQVYDYPSLISSESIFGSLFINYNYGSKVVFGVGGTGGYDKAQGSTPEQFFEQANVRLIYQASGKLSFAATVGVEFRQFGNDARGQYTSPVYDLSGSYQPFDGTTVSVTGSRRTQNSAVVSGSDFASTIINLGIRQRLIRRAYLGLNVGYENDDYFSAMQGVGVSRSDDYYYIQPSIDVNVTRFWSIGVYYLHREDSSSLAFFTFSDNQFGARTSLTF
jgi:hypothetical protein